MPGYFKGSLLSALIAITVFATAQEPVKPKLTPRIMTATRQVSMFTNLEIQLLEAVRKKDKAVLQTILADDFAIDMPDADRLPGDDWLDSVMAKDYIGQFNFQDATGFGLTGQTANNFALTGGLKFDF